MKMYILEIILFILIGLSIIEILKINGSSKIKLAGVLLISGFVITLGASFILEKPEVNLKNTKLSYEVKDPNSLEIPKTYYHFRDVTKKVKVEGNVDFNKVGVYEIEYVVPTLVGEYKTKQTVSIVDTLSPALTLDGSLKDTASFGIDYVEPGYLAIDNYDGDITSNVEIEKEEISESEYNLIYKVEDSSHNKSEKIRKINVIDDIAPKITLKGKSAIYVLENESYEESGATATDNKDGDLTSKIEISGEVDTTKVGTYNITYKVVDSSGNIGVEERKVIVYKKKEELANFPTDNNGVIYLTFDDGPSEYTGKLLDILKKYNVKATFFVTNQNITQGHDNEIKRAYDEGHKIGLHSYSHNYNSIYASSEAYFNDLEAISLKVENITGYKSTLIRFPGGSSNTVSRFNPGIMTYLTSEVKNRGYYYFDWNIDSNDAGSAKTTNKVYQNVIKELKPGRANIILQHDIKSYSVDAVDKIIQYGINNGYTFASLSDTTYGAHHHINN